MRKKLHKTILIPKIVNNCFFFLEINIKVKKKKEREKEIREMSTGIKHSENPFLVFTSNIQSTRVQLIWKEECVENLEKENRQLLILNGEKPHNVQINCQLSGTLKSTWITEDVLRWSRGKRRKNMSTTDEERQVTKKTWITLLILVTWGHGQVS